MSKDSWSREIRIWCRLVEMMHLVFSLRKQFWQQQWQIRIPWTLKFFYEALSKVNIHPHKPCLTEKIRYIILTSQYHIRILRPRKLSIKLCLSWILAPNAFSNLESQLHNFEKPVLDMISLIHKTKNEASWNFAIF